jgi:hypothetical protein
MRLAKVHSDPGFGAAPSRLGARYALQKRTLIRILANVQPDPGFAGFGLRLLCELNA